MASFVNAADIVAAAVEIERRGHAFYTAAEKQAQNADDKKFFAFMASEELRHEGIFSGILKRVGGLPLPAGSSDEEYLSYVHSLLDSHALFMDDDQAALLTKPLLQAMRLEKDTLVFFLELENLVPDAEKSHVRACADEERKHLRLLALRIAEKK